MGNLYEKKIIYVKEYLSLIYWFNLIKIKILIKYSFWLKMID